MQSLVRNYQSQLNERKTTLSPHHNTLIPPLIKYTLPYITRTQKAGRNLPCDCTVDKV